MYHKIKRRTDKPIVVEWKSDKGNSLKPKWTMFDRYTTEEIAKNGITKQLLKSNMFLFRIRGNATVYCRGY